MASSVLILRRSSGSGFSAPVQSASKGSVQSGFWWMPLFPSLVFVTTILCINFIGDGLRDAFDPKQDKGSK